MSPEDVPAEWVEKAARAIHEAECCPLDQDSQCYGWPLSQETERARHALAAVLPLAEAKAWGRGYAASDYEAYHLGTHGRTDNPYEEGSQS